MKGIIKLLTLLILLNTFVDKKGYSQKSNNNNNLYYAGIGLGGGYLLYEFWANNKNPNARHYKKQVKSIENSLLDSKKEVFSNKNNIISEIQKTETFYEKAKDKSFKFHSDFQKYKDRLYTSKLKFSTILYSVVEDKVKQNKISFNNSINKNELSNAIRYNDSLKLLYNSISWTNDNTKTSDLKQSFEKNQSNIELIKSYFAQLEKLKETNITSKIPEISNNITELKKLEHSLNNENLNVIIENNVKIKREINLKIKENYTFFLKNLSTSSLSDVELNISNLKNYQELLKDSTVEFEISKQKKSYYDLIIKKIKINLSELHKTKQSYANIDRYDKLISLNNELFKKINENTESNTDISKIKEQNESYTTIKSNIYKKQKAKERKQQIYYNQNYYNGHRIHTGPRGGKYYLNNNGNKVYLKYR